MKKKKKMMYIIMGVVLLLILGIGGGKYMENKKEEDRKAEQVQLEDAKQEVALYIVQHYEGVEKIQFGDMVKIDTAGSWDVTAKVNQSNSMGISFDSLDTIASSIVCRTNPKTFKLIEKNDTSKSLEHILVKYGDGFK